MREAVKPVTDVVRPLWRLVDAALAWTCAVEGSGSPCWYLTCDLQGEGAAMFLEVVKLYWLFARISESRTNTVAQSRVQH